MLAHHIVISKRSAVLKSSTLMSSFVLFGHVHICIWLGHILHALGKRCSCKLALDLLQKTRKSKFWDWRGDEPPKSPALTFKQPGCLVSLILPWLEFFRCYLGSRIRLGLSKKEIMSSHDPWPSPLLHRMLSWCTVVKSEEFLLIWHVITKILHNICIFSLWLKEVL